jgi:hypothetical protein
MKFELKKGFEVPVKRFCIDGEIFNTKCPECGADVEHDFNYQYLSYPTVGGGEITVYCDGCDHDWDVEYDMQISIEIKEG